MTERHAREYFGSLHILVDLLRKLRGDGGSNDLQCLILSFVNSLLKDMEPLEDTFIKACGNCDDTRKLAIGYKSLLDKMNTIENL